MMVLFCVTHDGMNFGISHTYIGTLYFNLNTRGSAVWNIFWPAVHDHMSTCLGYGICHNVEM
jgi:hypothetical protein